MSIFVLYRFFVGFAAAGFVGVLIIVASSLMQGRPKPWHWCRSSLICFLLSVLMGLLWQRESLISQVNKESMATTLDHFFASVSYMAASISFGLTGLLAGSMAAELLLDELRNRRSRSSVQQPPRSLPEHRD